jgi:hypothetical protein
MCRRSPVAQFSAGRSLDWTVASQRSFPWAKPYVPFLGSCWFSSPVRPQATEPGALGPSESGTASSAPRSCQGREEFAARLGPRTRQRPGTRGWTRSPPSARPEGSARCLSRVGPLVFRCRQSRVAQLVEQVTVNHRVGGSSPSSGASKGKICSQASRCIQALSRAG